MGEGRERTIRVGPATIKVVFTGEELEFIGRYQEVGESSQPDAVLRANLSEDFCEADRSVSNYPEFNSVLSTTHSLSVERSDVRGSLELRPNEPIQAEFEAQPMPHNLESMIRIVASLALPRKGTLILHSSAVVSGDEAHVFSGVSGAGKSTISGLLAAHSDARVLADDLVLLSHRADAWVLEVAPFSGKLALPYGSSAALASLNLLEQAPDHQRLPLSPPQAMRGLPRHVVAYVKHPATLGLVLSLIGELVESVPCYTLRFAKSPDVGSVFNLPCH